MLNTIRRAQPAIIKGVLGAVVVAFVATIFLDWGWRRPGRPDAHVATVGGQGVSLREFQFTYTNLTDFYRRLYQDRFTEDFARALNLKQQALDTLLQRKILLHQAKRQKLMVSDAELIERVYSYPVFQLNGHFDPSRYLQVLRLSQLTPGDFEQNQREELLLGKLENLIKDGVQVTEIEVKQAFIHDKEQVNVEYVRVDPAQFAEQVEVGEADLSTYYQAHPERFRKPEQARIAYVMVDPEPFAAGVHLTDEQLAQYYEERKEEFRQEEQVRARHILFKLAQQGGAEEETGVRAEAEAALQRIRAGEDFAALAAQLSQDPVSAQQGGDLGFFKRGEMVKPFEDTAFGLQPGTVSEPVRTDFGYHLIKVEEVQEAGHQPLEAVRAELSARLTREEARRLAEAKAQAVYEAMATAGNDWRTAAQALELMPRETPFIAQGAVVEGIENSAPFTQAAFALQEEEVSRPTLIGNQYVIMKLLERKASHLPPVEEVKDMVREALVRERSNTLARQKAEEWLAEVRAGKSLEQLAQAVDSQTEQTGFFSRNGTIPKLGRPQGFIREVFHMRVGEARITDLFEQPTVVVLKEHKELDAEAYEKGKPEMRQQVLRQKREQTFSQWATELRRQAEERREIFVNQSLLTVF
ncbi:MAG: SurA N-terminal domain-containing protein [Candidatus Tectomicrobia bacterium]|nr:SurA N-terminal domain-containing protein [Candidatus Tectomicrobia bacterium]